MSFLEDDDAAPLLSASAKGMASSDCEFSRTVDGVSVDKSLLSETSLSKVILRDGLVIIGEVFVVSTGVFDTFEIVTVVLIDCFSTERCLLSVASDMTI
jgi:hypothetical protein